MLAAVCEKNRCERNKTSVAKCNQKHKLQAQGTAVGKEQKNETGAVSFAWCKRY